jgi:hypothetical protein
LPFEVYNIYFQFSKCFGTTPKALLGKKSAMGQLPRLPQSKNGVMGFLPQFRYLKIKSYRLIIGCLIRPGKIIGSKVNLLFVSSSA